jgi:hypothetical protein
MRKNVHIPTRTHRKPRETRTPGLGWGDMRLRRAKLALGDGPAESADSGGASSQRRSGGAGTRGGGEAAVRLRKGDQLHNVPRGILSTDLAYRSHRYRPPLPHPPPALSPFPGRACTTLRATLSLPCCAREGGTAWTSAPPPPAFHRLRILGGQIACKCSRLPSRSRSRSHSRSRRRALLRVRSERAGLSATKLVMRTRGSIEDAKAEQRRSGAKMKMKMI